MSKSKYKKAIINQIESLGLTLVDYNTSSGHQKFFVSYNNSDSYKLIFPGSPSNGCAMSCIYIRKSIKQQANIPSHIINKLFAKPTKTGETTMVKKKTLTLGKVTTAQRLIKAEPKKPALTPAQMVQLGQFRLQQLRASL